MRVFSVEFFSRLGLIGSYLNNTSLYWSNWANNMRFGDIYVAKREDKILKALMW